MHSLYLSHLVEIADGSRHALAINSRICAAFCILPVCYQLFLNIGIYTHAPANVATNTTAIPCTLGAHDPPLKHAKAKLADKVVRKSYIGMRSTAIALNYSVKDKRNDICQIIIKNIYIII